MIPSQISSAVEQRLVSRQCSEHESPPGARSLERAPTAAARPDTSAALSAVARISPGSALALSPPVIGHVAIFAKSIFGAFRGTPAVEVPSPLEPVQMLADRASVSARGFRLSQHAREGHELCYGGRSTVGSLPTDRALLAPPFSTVMRPSNAPAVERYSAKVTSPLSESTDNGVDKNAFFESTASSSQICRSSHCRGYHERPRRSTRLSSMRLNPSGNSEPEAQP